MYAGQTHLLPHRRQRRPRHPLRPAGGRGLRGRAGCCGPVPRHAGRKALPRQRQRAGRRPVQQPERPSRGGGGGAAPPRPGSAGRSLRAGRCPHDQAGSPGRCAGEAGRPPGRHPVGRGGRDGQRQRGAGIGRAPGPGLRSGVQAGGLCAHQSQPRKIQDPEPRPRGGACPRRPFGPARAGRCLHRRQQGQPCRHRGRRAG